MVINFFFVSKNQMFNKRSKNEIKIDKKNKSKHSNELVDIIYLFHWIKNETRNFNDHNFHMKFYIFLYITLPNNLQTKIWKKKKRADILDFVVYIAIIYWYFEFVFLNFWFYNDLKINVNL